jgi:hypothetical protein
VREQERQPLWRGETGSLYENSNTSSCGLPILAEKEGYLSLRAMRQRPNIFA